MNQDNTTKKSTGFTGEERAAIQERANQNKADWENDVLIKASALALTPKIWHGMPANANLGGKIVCFFQTAQKFDSRYATFGFNNSANLDEGDMWPTSFALKALTAIEEAKIIALVKKALR